jgi:hypothetical protein
VLLRAISEFAHARQMVATYPLALG